MNLLDKIIQRKKEEVARLKEKIASHPEHPLRHEVKKENTHAFLQALRQEGLGVIAEVKRKSPSAGSIGAIQDPLALAKLYEAGGAVAISVLTDEESFGGRIEDLEKVSTHCKVPTLRKDFIIDRIQIAEAVLAGAEAILLIVRVLGEKTGEFIHMAEAMGVDAFVEVNDEEELKVALKGGAKIIGVNNRDLRTFEVDIAQAERLVKHIPDRCIKVAASGIKNVADAHRMRKAGYDAILVGETLVRDPDPKTLIQEMHDTR